MRSARIAMGCGGSKGGSDAPGTISSPTFVTGLPNGELCIACKQTLNVITSGGEPVRQIPKLDAPRGIVAMGDALFVCELNTHCVRKLKLGDGSQLASFGSKGAGDGELQFPGYTHAHTQTHTRARRHARARTQTHTPARTSALSHRSLAHPLGASPVTSTHVASGGWRAWETRSTWLTGAISGWWR